MGTVKLLHYNALQYSLHFFNFILGKNEKFNTHIDTSTI